MQPGEYDDRPATTPEAMENQIIAAAYSLAKKQIIEGTASAMVITHFLKLGSAKEKLEQQLLAERTRLATAKTEKIDQDRKTDELYAEVIKAMKGYQGLDDEEDYEDY